MPGHATAREQPAAAAKRRNFPNASICSSCGKRRAQARTAPIASSAAVAVATHAPVTMPARGAQNRYADAAAAATNAASTTYDTAEARSEKRCGRPAGASNGLVKRCGRQTRLNTSVPLVPPKPKLFFTATSIFISRAVFAQ